MKYRVGLNFIHRPSFVVPCTIAFNNEIEEILKKKSVIL